MKIYKKNILLVLSGLFFNILTIHCQATNDDAILYNWFDNTVGKVNLDINKGPIYSSSYQTMDNNSLYLVDNKYTLGNIVYDNEVYYKLKLNYDVFRDILILNSNDSELIGITLSKEKVNSFSIHNKNFVKINSDQYNLPEFITGYYEMSQYDKNLILYIKHHKKIDYNTLKDGIDYFFFKNNNSYYLDYKKKLYPINAKNDLIKIFPENKKRINEFYSTNKNLKTNDPNQFMKNLLKAIVTSDYNSPQK